jgi:hypothetical protein
MDAVRRHIKSIALGLLSLLVVQTIGCNTFVPLSETLPADKDAKIDARLRVHTRDEALYVFPANQYTVRYNADSTIARVRGWGDKYTSFGLVDRGESELTSLQIKSVEIEKLSTGRLALIAGAVVGFSVLTFLGVKAVGGDAGSGGGRVEGPAAGN